jgi:hypothetical protein
MKALDAVFVTLLSTLASAQERPALHPDPPAKCDECEAWNAPREPFRLFGNSA